MTGREWALTGGTYAIITDDVLFGVPHEHQDTAAVLAVLDSARACVAFPVQGGAMALLTLVDSAVAHALFMWPDSTRRPSLDSVAAHLALLYGPPDQAFPSGGRAWKRDSLGLYVHPRGPYMRSLSVTLSDARACAWFEARLHRRVPRPNYADAASRECWVGPPAQPGTTHRKRPAG